MVEVIKTGSYEFSGDGWAKISEEAKDLVTKLMNKNVKSRFSPSEALAHPWIINVNKKLRKCF